MTASPRRSEEHPRRATGLTRELMQLVEVVDYRSIQLIDGGRAQECADHLRNPVREHFLPGKSRNNASASVTAGLAWVPDTEPVT